MRYDNYYDSYNNDSKSLYDYPGPKKQTKRRWFVLLVIFLVLAIPIAIRYLIDAEIYLKFEQSVFAFIWQYMEIIIVVLVAMGIIFGIMEVKYENVDAEISKVVDQNYGHDISFLGMFSYISTAVSSKKCLIFSRDDIDTFYKKRMLMIILQSIYKFILPCFATMLILTRAFYEYLPTDWSNFDFYNFAPTGEYYNMYPTSFFMQLGVYALLFLAGNADILMYYLLRLVPFGETFKADVTYKITTYSNGSSYSRYETRRETVSTVPIMILIAIICYGVFSALFFIPIANCWCRLNETLRVKKFFKEYPDANSIEDYYQSTIDDYYAVNR